MQVLATKYLVGVDGSAESRVALKLACMKAAARGGSVDLLHIIPPADFQSLHAVADRMQEEQRDAAEKMVQTLCEEARTETGILPNIMLREGVVGDAFVSAALEQHDASMLVIGVSAHSASRGSLASWLFSHLGTKLLIPLVLVPGNLTEAQLRAMV